jgi:hypothetical protein
VTTASLGSFGPKLYVTDNTLFGRGAGGVFQQDPSGGTPTLIAPSNYDLAHGNYLAGPTAIAAMNGALYVANAGSDGYPGYGAAPNIVKITYSQDGWQQRLVPAAPSAMDYFRDPAGLVPVPGSSNSVYWADAKYQGGAIIKVNLDNGTQTVLTQGGLLNSPVALTQELDGNGIPTGNLIVVNAADGNVLRWYDDTGLLQVIASLGPGSHVNSVAFGPGVFGPQTIFVGVVANGTTPGTIYAINSSTGVYGAVTTGQNLSLVEGMVVSDNSLYVCTSPSPACLQDPSSAPIGIMSVNPSTGAQTTLYARPPGLFCLPIDICEDATGQYLFVDDYTAFDTGAIIRIDTSGHQTLWAWGGYLDGPETIACINGQIYCTNLGDSSFATHRLVRIDPVNQNVQTDVSELNDNPIRVPEGMVPVYENGILDPDSLYLVDQHGNANDAVPGQVYKVTFSTGATAPFGDPYPIDGEMTQPASIAWNRHANLRASPPEPPYYVMTQGYYAQATSYSPGALGGGVVALDQSGLRSLISGTPNPDETTLLPGDINSGPYLRATNFITVGNGTVFETSLNVDLSNRIAGIVAVDITPGAQGAQSLYSKSRTYSLDGGLVVYSANPGPPADHFAMSAPDTTVAGSPFDVTVTAIDSQGQIATAYTGTVAFTSSDAYPGVLPATYTFTSTDQGMHTFSGGVTLFTAGVQTLSVQDATDSSIVGSATLTVSPSSASRLFLTAPATAIAGIAFNVTVTALDPYGNVALGYTGTVTLTSSDRNPEPSDYTFTPSDNGTHTFGVSLFTAGAQSLSAWDAAKGSIRGSATLAVRAAPAIDFLVTAPATALAGMPFDVIVTALDPYGNTETNYQGTVQFITSDQDPGVLLPPNYTFTRGDNGDNGVRTFVGGATLITPGNQELLVSDTISGIDGMAMVTVVSGGAAPPPAGGGAQPSAPSRTSDPTSAGSVPPGPQVASVDRVFTTRNEENSSSTPYLLKRSEHGEKDGWLLDDLIQGALERPWL